MSQIASNGGQPQKQPKYAPIYSGRFFNGLNTNRSPLRAASANHIAEKFYSDNSGDALIAGLNLEVSNRLTLIRRPGNPIYDDTHTYNDPWHFDEFRVNKQQDDVLGTVQEQIFTMVDESAGSHYNAGTIYSLTPTFERGGDSTDGGLSYVKSAGAGQTYFQAVGNSLYFGDGVENKKWLQSLINRNAAGANNFQLQGPDGLSGAYPFGTYLLDWNTGNPQQFIGITIGTVTNIAVASNVLTLTVNLATPSPNTNVNDYTTGTSFQLWGFTDAAALWLNGLTVTLSSAYDHTASPHKFVAKVVHTDYTNASPAGTPFIIQSGTTPVIAQLGGSIPTYSTQVPTSANLYQGGLTLDGNTVWVNRGTPSTGGYSQNPNVENWGLKAPTSKPTYSVTSTEQSWQKNTYYSPASVYQATGGYLWQITTSGKTGSVAPTWPNPPAATSKKVVITNVSIAGSVATFTTQTQSPQVIHDGNTVVISNLSVATFLNGTSLLVNAGSTTTSFTANVGTVSYPTAADFGIATLPGTTQADGTAVWTAIQTPASLTWAAHMQYNVGDFLLAPTAAGTQLFQLGPKTQPFLNSAVTAGWIAQNSVWQGAVSLWNSADTNAPAGNIFTSFPGGQTGAVPSLDWNAVGGGNTMIVNTVNGAGELVPPQPNLPGTPLNGPFWASATGKIFVPAKGSYTFTIVSVDAGFFSFDTSSGNCSVSGNTFIPQTGGTARQITVTQGYGNKTGATSLCGNDNTAGSPAGSSCTWTFTQPGNYAYEVNFAQKTGTPRFVTLKIGAAQEIAITPDESGATQPTWPSFTTTGAQYNTITQQIVWPASVAEAATQYLWNNLGPATDYVYAASTAYTLPAATIIDSNGNQEGVIETGISGATQPSPWPTAINTVTKDTGYPTLQWINEGSLPTSVTAGTISATSTQGYLYWLALVNTLDNTVSNVGPVSAATGQFLNGEVTFAAGAGLPISTTTGLVVVDPQADYVAIFRTADGFTTPLLEPGLVNSPWTVPLTQYLKNGYVDTTPDTQLDVLIQGAAAGENTPPIVGAVNLTYALNRIWYSLGNTVYYTTGPQAPSGNGIDGTAPTNLTPCPSTVKRLVPTAIGMLVFTISDIYIIAGQGTTNSPIQPAIAYLTGVGLGNYNALDINGGIMGFFTTDKQFVIFDPSAGLSYVGYNIGDQLRLNNGTAGQSWNPSTAYTAWYINGEDQAWFLGDAVNGWYKLIATPAPESGNGVVAWSPFATIAGGSVSAIKATEVSPGVHKLLLGQTSATGRILNRDLSATTDAGVTGSNGTTYPAYGVIGSIVLAQPGQIAKVAFITTVCVRTGTPPILGVLLDEALPYYTGSFDMLKHWTNDPPNLPQGKSFYRQRFYLAEDEETSAYVMDMQIMVQFPSEAAMNELQTMTVYGAYEVEM